MGLRGSGSSLQVTLILVGPDGEVIDLLDGNAGDDQVAEFTKPAAASGVHTMVWAQSYTGLYITCSGFTAES